MLRLDRVVPVVFVALLAGAACWPASNASGAASPGKLRYHGKEGQTYAYDVTIKAETDDYTEELKGTVTFKYDSLDGELLKVAFRGGLNKTRKSKPKPRSSRGFGPFGPGFPRIPRPPSPFARPTFTGTVTTNSNQLTVTPRGRVVNMTGDSQLPYLLGNLSVMMFEPLPEEAQPDWTVNVGVAITEEEQDDRFGPFGRFGPRFGPFSQNRPEERTAASEVYTYSTERVDGPLVVVNKTYRLDSPSTGEGKESFRIDGTGKWTFNRELGISESLDFKQSLVVTEGNATITFPVSIAYSRVPQEEWEKREAARIAAVERARQEREKKEAEKKAKAEAPIEGADREEVLAALKSSNLPKLESTLKMLAGKTEREDAEIAAAIEPLLKHPHSSVEKNAKAALAKFSPEFKRVRDLNDAYSHHRHSLSELGPPVTDGTPLPPGLVVAARRHGKWAAAKVVQVLEGDKVQIKFREWPWPDTVSRVDMRLAPPEVEQPDVDPSMIPGAATAGASADGYRTWTDDTGTFEIEAKYVGQEGDEVRLLRKSDGKEAKVRLSRLSEADRRFVERAREKPKVTNPFEP